MNPRCRFAGRDYCDDSGALQQIVLPHPPEHLGARPTTELDTWVWYFAGWEPEYTWDSWEILSRNAPRRVPLLGDPAVTFGGSRYYRNAHPDVLAWHVRWMREAGISTILFEVIVEHDSDGRFEGPTYTSRTLERAFLGKAEIGGPPVDRGPYADDISFAVMWTNFAPGSGYERSSREMADYLMTQYLRQPNYARLDGRPVLFLWDADVLVDVAGSLEGARAVIEDLRASARANGVGELMIVTVKHPKELATVSAVGVDGLTAYHYFGTRGVRVEERRTAEGVTIVDQLEDFHSQTLPGYTETWRAVHDFAQSHGLEYLVPVCAQQDWRPLDRDWESRAYLDTAPQGLADMVRAARAVIDEGRLRPVIILEAWNEWGEGGYCEPSLEFGFEWLNALRAANGADLLR